MKRGDLVIINPVFFGYDNILPKWHESIFVVLEVKPDLKRTLTNPYIVCNVLTPEGTIYNFYDYELKDCYLVDDEQ